MGRMGNALRMARLCYAKRRLPADMLTSKQLSLRQFCLSQRFLAKVVGDTKTEVDARAR
jgi:hypothetical protein